MWTGLVDEHVAALAAGEPDAGEELLRLLQELQSSLFASGEAQPGTVMNELLRGARALALRPDALPAGVDPLAPLRIAFAAAPFTKQVNATAQLAVRVAAQLAADGRVDDARGVLHETLRALPEATVVRPYVHLTLAEYARSGNEWTAATEQLELCEATLLDIAPHRAVRCSLLGIRGQIYLDQGLTDVAARWFDQERAALDELDDAAAREGSNRRASNLHMTHLALALADQSRLEHTVADALADDALYARQPGQRAALLVRLGLGQMEHERRSKSTPGRALEILREALAEPGLAELERMKAEVYTAEALLRAGELESVAPLLDAAATRFPALGALTPEVADVARLRASLALARGAPESVLRERATELQAAFDLFVAHWQSQELRPGGYSFLHFVSSRALLAELMRVRIAAARRSDPAAVPEAEEEAFELLLRAQALGSLARRAGQGPGSLAEVRAELVGPRHGLLVYLPSVPVSHLFVIDEAPLQHFELVDRDAIQAVRGELLRELTRSPFALPADRRARRRAELDELALQLAEMLLPAEVHAKLAGWSAVTIVGADLFGELPFECLPLPNGERLGRAKALDYLPSLPVGLLQRRRELERDRLAPGTGAVRVLAATRPAAEITARWPTAGPLELEAGALQAWLAPHERRARDAELWLDDRATRDALADANLSGVGLLHVLAHGVHDYGFERPAALVLGAGTSSGPDAGLFWSADAERLNAPSVVVLSACGTARGPDRRGDAGASDLSGAFLQAGARAVVLSSVDLELSSTLALMGTFHERLARGDSPAEALRAAREALSGTDGERYVDPYYDALVHVVGLGHLPLFTPDPVSTAPTAYWPWVALGLAAAGGGAFVLRRRAA